MIARLVRIVNVIEEARVGGPQRRIIAVAEKLRLHGLETIVYTAERDCAGFTERLKAQSTPYRTFPLVRLQSGLGNQFRYALDVVPQIWRYYRALRHDRPDIVHANSAAQWRPVVAARLAGVPAVWHLNDTSMPAVVRMLFRLTQRFASAFIVAGRRVERYYLPRGAGGRPVTLIHAPVDTSRFFPDPHRTAADVAALPGLKIVNVGNVNPDKDIETFIRVAAEVLQTTPQPVSFVQVGGLFDSQDAYTSRLRGLARELGAQIHFLGHRSDIADILRACDIYLHTARNEASPMAIWEALAVGLPVVSTDVGDVADVRREAIFGSVSPVGNVAELVQAVLGLLSATEQRRLAGQIAQQVCEQHFTLEATSQRHQDIYRLLMPRAADGD